MNENAEQFVVKTWLEEAPQHYSVSLPHPEDEAKAMQESAKARTPKTAAVIEPYVGQIPGQH